MHLQYTSASFSGDGSVFSELHALKKNIVNNKNRFIVFI